MDLILNNLLLIFIILIGLFVLGFVFRSIKFILFIGLIILLLGFFGFLGDGFNDKAKETFDNAATYTQEKAVPMIKESLETAEFTFDKETGSYVIGAERFRVEGTEGDNQGRLIVGNTTTNLDVSFLSDFIKEQIATSEQNQ